MQRDWKTYAVKIAVLAGAYYGTALGLDLAFGTTSVTAVWPPPIALAALLLWGYRLWPGVASAPLANSWTDTLRGAWHPLEHLEALAGAWLLHRVAGWPRLDRSDCSP